MSADDSTGFAGWMLLLTGLVVAFLVAISLLRLSRSGDVGSFLKNLGIGVVLATFSAGFYWKWRGE